MELRIVDPRKLRDSLDNPRKTQPGKDEDAQLVASIKAIGLRQPPLVRETDDTDVLEIVAGRRRVKAAIKAKLKTIHVLVQHDADAEFGPMVAVAENVVRADMGPIDRWRAMEALSGAGWTDEAIAISLNLTARNIAKLRLLGRIYPAMLDHMALGDMPDEGDLRAIAAASTEEQAAVWAKNKPKRNSEAEWWQIAKALSKDRISATAAKFSDEDAARFGIVWEEDLFAPAGADSRTTTQVDEFMAAQQAWLEANLPANGVVVEMDRVGRPVLPKGAQERYGKAGEGDMVAHYLDNGGNVRTAVYSPPPPKNTPAGNDAVEDAEAKPPRGVTQKGATMIGDLRTDALHEALWRLTLDDDTLIGLLVLALGSRNVDIRPGVSNHYGSRGAGRSRPDWSKATCSPATAKPSASPRATCLWRSSPAARICRAAGRTPSSPARRSVPTPSCRTWRPRTSLAACRSRCWKRRPTRRTSPSNRAARTPAPRWSHGSRPAPGSTRAPASNCPTISAPR